MAAEGEFAFVIAAFSVDKGIIDEQLYSSIVLAILLSTIIAPFSLRFTINYFNKKAEQDIIEAERLVATGGDIDDELKAGILEGSTIFFCVNTTSHGAWGTLPKLMHALFDLELSVIDHRSWHTRYESTVVNEVYVKGELKGGTDVGDFTQKLFNEVQKAIDQPDAVISVTRWFPGLIDDISKHEKTFDSTHVANALVEEARKKLETSAQMAETKDNLRMASQKDVMASIGEDDSLKNLPKPSVPPPRRRVRITSTPAGGGDMFGEVTPQALFRPGASIRGVGPRRGRQRTVSTPLSGDMFGDTAAVVLAPGEVLLNVVDSNGKKMPIKVMDEVYKKIKASTVPLTLTELKRETAFAGEYLDGFIRKQGRSRTLSNLDTMKDGV